MAERSSNLSSADASQLVVVPIMPSPTTSSNIVAGSRPAANPPSSPSFASQFAATTTVTHSKQNNNNNDNNNNDDAIQALEQDISPKVTNSLPKPSLSIQDADNIPPSSDSLPLGGMMNWANTKLETTSVVTTPSTTPT